MEVDFSLMEFNYFHSEFSQILECLTSPTPPGVPDRPTAVCCGTDFIELAWKEPETHGCKFKSCFSFDNSEIIMHELNLSLSEPGRREKN